MTIHHHPGDDLLLSLATGSAEAGTSLLVSAHLEGCPQCRARLRVLEAIGGALLADAEPQALLPAAWAGALDRIAAPVAPAPVPAPSPRPALPPGVPWPRSLRGCTASGWRWMGPGMHWSRVTCPEDPSASLFLLRIAPGRSLPRHTHTDVELTQVLCGSFDDGRAAFGAGDFDAADEAVHHQPVVRPGSECVCLAYVSGRLRFDGRIASLIGGWIGM